MRSLDDIAMTGASWITEAELAAVIAQAQKAEAVVRAARGLGMAVIERDDPKLEAPLRKFEDALTAYDEPPTEEK